MPNQIFNLKTGDTRPRILATIQVDQSDVISSVKFSMRDAGGSLVITEATGAIEQQATAGTNGNYFAKISYQWVNGDSNIAGTYQAEFEVTFSDTRVETYPNDGYLTIKITGALA